MSNDDDPHYRYLRWHAIGSNIPAGSPDVPMIHVVGDGRAVGLSFLYPDDNSKPRRAFFLALGNNCWNDLAAGHLRMAQLKGCPNG